LDVIGLGFAQYLCTVALTRRPHWRDKPSHSQHARADASIVTAIQTAIQTERTRADASIVTTASQNQTEIQTARFSGSSSSSQYIDQQNCIITVPDNNTI
jgi:hypothetical protein